MDEKRIDALLRELWAAREEGAFTDDTRNDLYRGRIDDAIRTLREIKDLLAPPVKKEPIDKNLLKIYRAHLEAKLGGKPPPERPKALPQDPKAAAASLTDIFQNPIELLPPELRKGLDPKASITEVQMVARREQDGGLAAVEGRRHRGLKSLVHGETRAKHHRQHGHDQERRDPRVAPRSQCQGSAWEAPVGRSAQRPKTQR